ncbi:MAG: ABC transporter substrate-binding protein [Verrucomicrobiales bacterium]|nr:ABC transporter substrate-binding protein [Verrucomicrobiales bacterium]
MGTKVRFVLPLTLAALVWSPLVLAQEAGTTYRIGLLSLISEPDDQASPVFGEAEITDAFLDELRKLGYEEGKNFVIERRYAAGEVGRLPDLAAELVELKPDLIFTESTPATRAAKEATSEIPIVFNIAANPVTEGFVASLGRPGGNLTGFNWWQPDELKSLQVLQEIVPDLKKVAVVCPTAELERCGPYVELLAKEASDMGLVLQMQDVAGPEEFDAFFAAARGNSAGAVLITGQAWFYGFCEELGQAAARSPLPVIFACTQFAEAGGLISNDVELSQGGRRTAVIVSRILEGANPGEIPVERPTLYELVLNLKTARTWGIELPEALLLQATRVIE